MAAKALVNLQVKTDPDISAAFDLAVEESELTRGKFLELLLYKYSNPKTEIREVPRAEDTARITELEHQVFLAQSENTILKEAANNTPPPPAGLVIPFTATDVFFIDAMKSPFERRNKTEIPRESFVHSMIKGLYVYGKIHSEIVFTQKEIRDKERENQPNE